jgi:hypothetical protein
MNKLLVLTLIGLISVQGLTVQSKLFLSEPEDKKPLEDENVELDDGGEDEVDDWNCYVIEFEEGEDDKVYEAEDFPWEALEDEDKEVYIDFVC